MGVGALAQAWARVCVRVCGLRRVCASHAPVPSAITTLSSCRVRALPHAHRPAGAGGEAAAAAGPAGGGGGDEDESFWEVTPDDLVAMMRSSAHKRHQVRLCVCAFVLLFMCERPAMCGCCRGVSSTRRIRT